MSSNPDYAWFAGLLNRIFRANLPRRTVDLRLETVSRLPPPRTYNTSGDDIPATHPGRQEPFTLFFRGPGDLYLPQATYRVTLVAETMEASPAAEPFEIFIVPIEGGRAGYLYQAIFN